MYFYYVSLLSDKAYSPAIQEKMEVLLTHCLTGGKVSNIQIFGEQLALWLNYSIKQE